MIPKKGLLTTSGSALNLTLTVLIGVEVLFKAMTGISRCSEIYALTLDISLRLWWCYSGWSYDYAIRLGPSFDAELSFPKSYNARHLFLSMMYIFKHIIILLRDKNKIYHLFTFSQYSNFASELQNWNLGKEPLFGTNMGRYKRGMCRKGIIGQLFNYIVNLYLQEVLTHRLVRIFSLLGSVLLHRNLSSKGE